MAGLSNGVKYVLVHREDYLKTELTAEIEELNKIPYNPGLKLAKTFPSQECPRKDIMCTQKSGEIDVYEVMVVETSEKVSKTADFRKSNARLSQILSGR